MRRRCSECGTSAAGSGPACPRCGGPIDAQVELPDLSGGLAPIVNESLRGLWRYRRAIAIGADTPPVTLGEGDTPVVALSRWGPMNGLRQVYAKLEYLGPTGSFKDRGAAVLVSELAARAVGVAVEDSSGNAGAALAAYCARAGIAARIFVPASAPLGKLAQIAAYGAELNRVSGSREDVAAAALAAAEAPDCVYASHSRDPLFLQGTKTFALEIMERFGEGVPEHLILPTGNGGLLLGAQLAFSELRAAGLRVPMPRLHIAQAAACAPLVQALERGDERPPRVTAGRTIAGGVAVANPFRGAQVLRAVRDSGGVGSVVADDAVRAARAQLALSEGLDLEPTAALGFAAAADLRARGVIGPRDRVLVAATGSGLKDPAD